MSFSTAGASTRQPSLHTPTQKPIPYEKFQSLLTKYESQRDGWEALAKKIVAFTWQLFYTKEQLKNAAAQGFAGRLSFQENKALKDEYQGYAAQLPLLNTFLTEFNQASPSPSTESIYKCKKANLAFLHHSITKYLGKAQVQLDLVCSKEMPVAEASSAAAAAQSAPSVAPRNIPPQAPLRSPPPISSTDTSQEPKASVKKRPVLSLSYVSATPAKLQKVSKEDKSAAANLFSPKVTNPSKFMLPLTYGAPHKASVEIPPSVESEANSPEALPSVDLTSEGYAPTYPPSLSSQDREDSIPESVHDSQKVAGSPPLSSSQLFLDQAHEDEKE